MSDVDDRSQSDVDVRCLSPMSMFDVDVRLHVLFLAERQDFGHFVLVV
jgi:hypothetical protein